MSAVKLTDGIYSVGIQNPNMRVFDIVMQTDSGTTYNSYIVRGSEKTALIATRASSSSMCRTSRKSATRRRSTTS